LLAFGAFSVLMSAALVAATIVGASIEDSAAWISSAYGRTTLAVLTSALFGLFALMRSDGEPLDARVLTTQALVVFGGGMLWVASPYGGSLSGCAFLLFAAAITSLLASGQPRLRFG
jgi:hypothetical protein